MKLASDQQADTVLQRHGLSADEIRKRFKPGYINYFVSEEWAGVTIVVQDTEFVTKCDFIIENVFGRPVSFSMIMMNGFYRRPFNLKPHIYLHPELYVDLVNNVQYYAVADLTDANYCKLLDRGLNVHIRLLDRNQTWHDLGLRIDVMMERLHRDQWQYLEQMLINEGLVVMPGYTYDAAARIWRSHDLVPQEYSSGDLQRKLINEINDGKRSTLFRTRSEFRVLSLMARLIPRNN